MIQFRHPRWALFGFLTLVGIALSLGGCSETTMVVYSAKQVGRLGNDKGKPGYKVGKPYQVGGRWYQPKEDYFYSKVGEASWYGPKFQGRRTANGEIFDMNKLTAAHPTLPMPSYVRVTNLENGRRIKIRVNDRGPFSRNRIIDVSRASARALGFEKKGKARVRVEILPEESRRAKIKALGGVFAAEPPPPIPARVSKVVRVSSAPGHYVQVGAFSDPLNAGRMSARLARLGLTVIMPVAMGDHVLYRVRLGPFHNRHAAENALRATRSSGYPGARIVEN